MCVCVWEQNKQMVVVVMISLIEPSYKFFFSVLIKKNIFLENKIKKVFCFFSSIVVVS